MDFKIILFVLVSVFSMHNTFSYIIQVDKVVTSDGKKITLLADRHERSPAVEEQIRALIGFLQKNNEDQNALHILLEKSSYFAKLCPSSQRFLPQLDERIEQIQPSLINVTLEDIEIRHIASMALDLLTTNELVVLNCYRTFVIDDQQRTVGTITFQDILDEFDQRKQALSDYYIQHIDQAVIDVYREHIEKATTACEQFKRNLEHVPSINGSILAYAKQRLLTENAILVDNIKDSFTHLLELHILKTILEKPSNDNVIVIAGGDHTSEVKTMLETLQATPIYRIRNVTSNIETPLTPSHIMQGLSAQPSWITGSPQQIFLVGITMSALACWLYAKYKATNEEKAAEDDCLDTAVAQDGGQEECPNEVVA